jgi:hypothetical protein
MKEETRAFLEADGTLAALLIGGVFAEVEVSRQVTAAAYDSNLEIQPCANVKFELQNAVGPHLDSAEQFIAISVYQLSAFDVIDPAVARIYALLQRQSAGIALVNEFRHVNTVSHAFDHALKCSMALIRFVVHFHKV